MHKSKAERKVIAKVQKPQPVRAGDIERAIERVRERYGNDLNAFYRDARQEIVKRVETSKSRNELCIQ